MSKTKLTITLGATIRVTRTDGSSEIYVLHGTDEKGPIYIDQAGKRHADIGMYAKVEEKTSTGWVNCQRQA